MAIQVIKKTIKDDRILSSLKRIINTNQYCL